MGNTNSFWLESLIVELTPRKEEMEDYRQKDAQLNCKLTMAARNIRE